MHFCPGKINGTSLQGQVDLRMREWGQLPESATVSGRYKSQRGGSDTVWVKRQVEWPHNFVFTGVNKARCSYDSLNPFQFVSGFAQQIKKEKDVKTKDIMLQYFSDLFEDANDFAWVSAKSCHAMICCRMEENILDWQDVPELDRQRRAYAQWHPVSKSEKSEKSDFVAKKKNFNFNSSRKNIVPCTFYNKGMCSHKKSDHESATTEFKHICSTCFAKGESIRHMAKFCTKND